MVIIDDITVKQINIIKHTIGFNNNRTTGIKHRKMCCYRNRFYTYTYSEEWELLISLELAESRICTINENKAYYHLTKKGFKFLADLFGYEEIYEID